MTSSWDFKKIGFLSLLLCLGSTLWAQQDVEFAPELRPRLTDLKPLESPEFRVPLWFDVVGDGVIVPPLELGYDLESSDGESLQMGPLKFSTEQFYISMVPLGSLNPRLGRLPKGLRNQQIFVLRWPDFMFEEGLLELIDRSGRVVWSQNIRKEERDFWKDELRSLRELLLQSQVPQAIIDRMPLFKTQWGGRDIFLNNKQLKSYQGQGRFCLSNTAPEGYTRLCTNPYLVEATDRGLRILNLIVSPQPPRVIVMNRQGKLADSIPVQLGKLVQFYAEIKSGASYEFAAIPKKFKIIELVESAENPEKVKVVIEGQKPLQESKPLHTVDFSALTEFFKWQQTIGDLRELWETAVDRVDPSFYIPGQGGGAFRQRFEISRLPREVLRPYLFTKSPKGTYRNEVSLLVKRHPKVPIKTTQNSISQYNKKDPSVSLWRYKSAEKGEWNKSYLLVEDGPEVFKVYREMYRGYSTEASARLTGIIGSNNNFILMGELALNHWFDDLFGWMNYTWSRQRWGVSMKSFRSFTPLRLPKGSDFTSTTLEQTTIDLKYRLTPGLWNRDKSWGVMLGAQSLRYDRFNLNMAGLGFFWARSMPKLFDDIFNKLEVLRYPKWVDLEFIYFPGTLTADSKINNPPLGLGTWSLNFHGKVLWGKALFGEAGFGIKNIDLNQEFRDPALTRLNLRFFSLYGTAGIGYSF